MEKVQNTPVAAVFNQRGQVETAIDELLHTGFLQDQIGMVLPGQGMIEAETPTSRREETAADGAVAGAVTGGALGALLGAGVTALIPGIGPVLAGGLLAGVALGAAAGAAGGSYLGPFLALGMSEEEAHRYRDEFRAGRGLVVVKAGERSAEALTILQRHGGHQVMAPGDPAAASYK